MAEFVINMSESDKIADIDGSDKVYWPRRASLVTNVVIDPAKCVVTTQEDGSSFIDIMVVTTKDSVATHADKTTTTLQAGAELKWRFFPVTMKGNSIQDQEEAAKKAKTFEKKHVHFLTKIIGVEKYDEIKAKKGFDGGSTKIFTNTLTLLQKYAAGKLLDWKILLNDEDFPSVPNYVPFCQVAGTNPSRLSFTSIDTNLEPKNARNSGGGSGARPESDAGIATPEMNVGGDDDDLPF